MNKLSGIHWLRMRGYVAALVPAIVFGSVTLTAAGLSLPAYADGAGAFLGGMITSRVLGNMRERTEAEQVQAAAATRQAQQPQVVYQQAPQSAPASSGGGGGKSVEQRLKELDSLASQGYITKQEYAARKKAIVDSI